MDSSVDHARRKAGFFMLRKAMVSRRFISTPPLKLAALAFRAQRA
jgi:hypothetical protein